MTFTLTWVSEELIQEIDVNVPEVERKKQFMELSVQDELEISQCIMIMKSFPKSVSCTHPELEAHLPAWKAVLGVPCDKWNVLVFACQWISRLFPLSFVSFQVTVWLHLEHKTQERGGPFFYFISKMGSLKHLIFTVDQALMHSPFAKAEKEEVSWGDKRPWMILGREQR